MNAEVMDQWGLANVQVQGGGKALKGHKPLRIPRPGDQMESDKKDRVITNPREIARWFA